MKEVNAAIITIGDELLIGQTIDTNSPWMAEELNKIGVWVKRRVAVGDAWDDIWHDNRKKYCAGNSENDSYFIFWVKMKNYVDACNDYQPKKHFNGIYFLFEEQRFEQCRKKTDRCKTNKRYRNICIFDRSIEGHPM